jgi:outer membrane protein
MKQFLSTLALAALLTPAATAQSTKLGHIDRATIIKSLPERDSAEKIMRGIAEKLDGRLKAMGAEFESRLAKYEVDRPTMTQTMIEIEERELKAMQENLVKAQSQAEEDLAKQEEELLAPMVKRVNDAIKAVADEKGFAYVFDTSTGMVLYYEKGEDIGPAVRTKLGMK